MKTKIEKITISFGNKKLPKNTMIFNLPAVKTCPGSTVFCRSKCYALKAERLYKQVLPSRMKNLKISKEDLFTTQLHEVIQKNIRKIKQIRVHESGDFYSQEYLNKWLLIASEYPSIKFYAYTKSFKLNFSLKPSNFVLIASFDNSTTDEARFNYQINKKYFDNTFSIVDKSTKASCIQDCTKCSLCWNKSKLNITVNVH